VSADILPRNDGEHTVIAGAQTHALSAIECALLVRMLTMHSPLGSFFRRRGQDHFCQLEFFTMYLLSRSLHLFLDRP